MKTNTTPLHQPADLPRKQRCHTCHGTGYFDGRWAGARWDCPDCDATGQASPVAVVVTPRQSFTQATPKQEAA